MIIIWGTTRWAVLANLVLAAAALLFGIYEAGHFHSFWGIAAAGFFGFLAITSDLARRRTARAEAGLNDDLRNNTDTRRCVDCGHLNQPNWNFCSNCGSLRGRQ